MYKTRILAQGIVDLSEQGAEATSKVFRQYVSSALPFVHRDQEATDAKMKEVMEREVKKGIITFSPPTANPLVQRAKEMQLPDEFRTKLANRKRVVEL